MQPTKPHGVLFRTWALACLSLVWGLASAGGPPDEDVYGFDDAVQPDSVDYPDWFNEPFLDLPDDLKQAVDGGKQGLMVYFGQKRCAYCHKPMNLNFRHPDIVGHPSKHPPVSQQSALRVKVVRLDPSSRRVGVVHRVAVEIGDAGVVQIGDVDQRQREAPVAHGTRQPETADDALEAILQPRIMAFPEAREVADAVSEYARAGEKKSPQQEYDGCKGGHGGGR